MEDFPGGIGFGVQQGGDQGEPAHPEALDVATAAHDADGDFLGQSPPDRLGQPQGRIGSLFPDHEPVILAQALESAAALDLAGGAPDEIDAGLEVAQEGQQHKIAEAPIPDEDVVGVQLAEQRVEHRQFGGMQITCG